MSYLEFVKLQDFNERFNWLLEKESERGAAVVVICFIDQYIDRVLAEYDDRNETLQVIPGSLAKSPRRLKKLYQRELATLEEVERLQLLRDVRNAFAHELEVDSFAAIAGMLGTAPELAGGAFRSLLQKCSSLLGGLLNTRYEGRRKAFWAYRNVRLQALRQIQEIDARIYTATLTNREGDKLTYTTSYGAQFCVGLDGERLAGVFAFTLDGSEWVTVNDSETGDDEFLRAWVAALPIDEWGTVGTGIHE
jgi:hypothetical protein